MTSRREFLCRSGLAAAAAAALPFAEFQKARASNGTAPPARVLADWHSHFVSNAEMRFFAARKQPPRLVREAGSAP